jgi:hypothetical protein
MVGSPYAVESQPSEESLRYYSHGGESEKLPLFHLDPSDAKRGSVSVIPIDENSEMYECRWCCRKFPDGMRNCRFCFEENNVYAHYCNDECQCAAHKIHKARYHHQFREGWEGEAEHVD